VDDWGRLPQVQPWSPSATHARELLARETEPQFRAIRTALRETETLLEERAEIVERVLRQARGLYKTGTLIGTIPLPADARIPMPKHVKATKDLLGTEPWEEPKELLEWEFLVLKGGGIGKRLSDEDKGIFREALELSLRERESLATMVKRADQLPLELLDLVEKFPWDAFELQGPTRECVQRDVALAQAALKNVLADQETLRRLELQIQVLEALIKGPGEVPPPEKVPLPTKEPEVTPEPKGADTKHWGFEVLGVKQGETYSEQYCKDGRELLPLEKGHHLLLVYCRLTNLSGKEQAPCLTERLAGNTAIHDAAGAAYRPLDYDASQASSKMQDYAALPVPPHGAADFVLVFSVPRELVPSRLVFTILRYPDDVGGAGTDVEVWLK